MREREPKSAERERDSGAPKPRAGGFKPDGSWDEAGTWDTPLGHFVRKLVMGRRFKWKGYPPYKASPADLARMIGETVFAEAFGNLENWRALEHRRDWPLTHASTSAAQAVISCGWGQLGGEWEQTETGEPTGRWEPDRKDLEAWLREVSRHQGTVLGEF